jgi:MinD-like ATPase involved in chromosome partitioning or flagellar assembly
MIDQWTGIHYFSPPQSGLEFDEIACDDIEYFFKQIKSTSTYDLVFVDMSSGFSDKNRMLLEMLDDIFFIVTPSSVSDMKARQIFKEFEFLERQKNSTINKKIKILLNDVNEGSACNLNTCERPIFMKIPKAETLFEQRENRLAIDLKGDFADSIKQLVTKVLEGEKNGQS